MLTTLIMKLALLLFVQHVQCFVPSVSFRKEFRVESFLSSSTIDKQDGTSWDTLQVEQQQDQQQQQQEQQQQQSAIDGKKKKLLVGLLNSIKESGKSINRFEMIPYVGVALLVASGGLLSSSLFPLQISAVLESAFFTAAMTMDA